MNSKSFKIVEIADIHFGNGRVSPIRTYEHLQKYLYPELEDASLFIINGDTFDTLLNMNSDAGLYVAKFIDEVVSLAMHYNFYIRVVRGTFSHDRHQNRFFTVKEKGEYKLNNKLLVRVIDKISIENFEELGINVLYCPDDQPHKDLTQAVIDIIESNHLETVDMICSHGYYEHLLPKGLPHIPHNTLSWDRLKKYVTKLVFNGHIHHQSISDHKVISSGSFERFDHSVTCPVGFWVVDVVKNKWNVRFVENKESVPFMTFISELYSSSEELYDSIANNIESIYNSGYLKSDPIYIRLIGNITSDVSAFIKETYPNVIITDKHVVTQQVFDEEIRTNCDELPVITEDNLAQMVFDNLEDKSILSLHEVEEIINEL